MKNENDPWIERFCYLYLLLHTITIIHHTFLPMINELLKTIMKKLYTLSVWAGHFHLFQLCYLKQQWRVQKHKKSAAAWQGKALLHLEPPERQLQSWILSHSPGFVPCHFSQHRRNIFMGIWMEWSGKIWLNRKSVEFFLD